MDIIHVLQENRRILRQLALSMGMLIVLILGSGNTALAQCPSVAAGLTAIATDVSCAGASDGTIQITVNDPNGYTGNYQYNMFFVPDVGVSFFVSNTTLLTANTFTGLPAGSAFFIAVVPVDDGSCGNLAPSVLPTISAPPAISIGSSTTADCDLLGTGTIDLNVSGGSGTFISYVWTGGLPNQEDHTNVPAGSYDVTVTDDSGCSNSLFGIVVDGPSDPTITPVAPVCTNDAAFNLSAATAGGTWSGIGITNAILGTFDPATAGIGVHTITYNLTDANGCISSDTENITVNAIPVINITPVAPICIDVPAFNMLADVAGGIWSGTGITNAATGEFDPAVAGAGTHPITYAFTNGNGCVGTDIENVTVNPLPDASFTGGPFCVDEAATTLTPALAGGTWAGLGITNAVTGEFDPAIAGVGSHAITYTVTDGNGCTNVAIQNIDVNPLPDPSINAAGPFCIDNGTVIMTAATPGGTWGGTGINAVTGEFDPALAGAGAHFITYNVTNGNGCSDNDLTIIVVNALPIVNVDPVAPVCIDGATFNMTADVAGGTWAGTGITNAATGEFDPVVAGVGTHSITYTFTDGNGCVGTDSEDVVVNPLPDASFTGGPFCANDAATTLTPVLAGGTWAGTGITNAATGEFDPTVAGFGSHAITYTVTDVNGCTNAAIQNIDVNPLPDPSINAAGPFCEGDAPIIMTAATPGGTWGGTGINAVTGEFDPALAGPGAHFITYNVTDGNGCSDDDLTIIVVNALPTVNVTPVAPVCIDAAAFNMTADVLGGTWAGIGITNAATGEFDPAIAGLGTHTITYTFTALNGCIGTDSEDVVVNPLPDASFAAAGPFCQFDPSVILTPTVAGGTWAGAGIINAVTGEFDPVTAGIGTHNITYSITDGNGCTNSSNQNIDVTAADDATITPVAPVCVDAAPFILTAATAGGTWAGVGITNAITGEFDPTVAGIGIHNVTYSITNLGGCVSNDDIDIEVTATPIVNINPAGPLCIDDSGITLTADVPGGTWAGVGITNAVTGDFDPAVAGVGTHSITYSVTDLNGCTGNDMFDVVVNPIPDPSINAAGPFCEGDAPIIMTAATPGGTWGGTGINAVTGEFDPAIAGPGAHFITYNVTDGNGCSDDDLTIIVVNAEPVVNINPVGTICIDNGIITLTADVAGGTWSGSPAINAATGDFDPNLAGAGTHTITYTFTNLGGCTGTDMEDIVVTPLPDAGTDVIIDICEDENAIDLFATLGGAPDGGGVFNDDDGVGGLTGNIFDATVGAVVGNSYNFTYTVTAVGCAPATATVTLNVVGQSNSGTGANGTACITTTNFDLYTLLTGHDAGGTWNDDDLTFALSGADNSIFDASAVAPGTGYNFTYIVNNPACGATGTTVTVNVVNSLNAGTAIVNNNTCDNVTDYDLFTGLTGFDAGGIWNDDDGTGALTANLFDASAIGPGTYNFTYTVSAPGCTDDSEQITVVVSTAPVADAGADQNTCFDTGVLGATLAANETGVWTVVAGTGIFADNTDPTTNVSGLSGGINTFQWEITNAITNCTDIATTNIEFIELTTPDAGPDQSICTTDITMAGNAFNAAQETGSWTYTGVFVPAPIIVDINDPNTQITGLVAGQNYVFAWTINDNNPFGCLGASDLVSIDVVGTLSIADAGVDQNTCNDNVVLNANAVLAGETGTWAVIAGTGIFADANDPSTTVTGLSDGLNQLEWRITDNSATCPASVDMVDINVNLTTIANAGPDQNICVTSATLAANAVGVDETGTWTVISGTAVFADINDPLTTVTGLTVGNNVLRWTISDDLAVCPDTQSDVNIDIVGTITAADAGPDQNICVDFTNMAGNAVAVGETGEWTVVSGTGVFADDTDPLSAVTGLSVGLNEFQWEISVALGCPPSADIVAIRVGPNTAPDAGPDQSICTDDATLAANAVDIDETGTWSLVSAGAVVFADINDPTTTISGLSPGINVLRWTIVDDNGGCLDRFDEVIIDVFGTLTSADAGVDQSTCDTFTVLAANATGGTETGTWTVASGTGIFADANDPGTMVTGLSVGLNEFQWQITDNVGTCPASDDIVAITVSGVTTSNAGPQQNICDTFTTLAANTVGAQESGTWSVMLGSGVFEDANDPNSEVTGLSVGLNQLTWTISDDTGICPTNSESFVVINVLDPTDPLCAGGGGTNCGAFTISVLEIRPTCTDNDDGEISFDIVGGSGNYTVVLTDNNGFTKGETGTNAASIVFQDLSAANYEYTVDDGTGNTCTLPYTLDRETTVQASGTNFVDVTCFGESTGEATITIDAGGNAPYEYSLDGFVWQTLAPNGVVTGIPALGTFNLLVRDDLTDQCPAQVEVTVNNLFPEMDLTFTTTEATCSSAGGSIEVTNTSGGLAPYSYRLDGLDFATLPDNNTFDDLSAGLHILTVIDDNNCEKDFNIVVNAPGLVLYSTSVTNPDCNGNGQNGSVTIQIDPFQLPGLFEAAISDDISEDGEFIAVPANGILEFPGLSVGNYFVTVTSENGCPNKIPANIISGPIGLSADVEVECFDNQQALLLSNITAEDNVPFNVEVFRIGEVVPVDTYTLDDLPAGRVFRISTGIFLNSHGGYQVRLTQNQVACGNTLESEAISFTINQPLAATLGSIEQSFPERPTGSVWFNEIQGGYEPYAILIEPGSGQFVDIEKNQTTQIFEHQITELFPGDYQVFIADDKGCELFFDVSIPRDMDIFIPNIFTPNGDSFNDTFFVRNLPTDGANLYISNRLGRKIYETDNYQNDWDAEGISDGIYFYKLEIEDEKFSGWIEVWRGGINK